jgi:hypothetical protein
MYKLYRYVTSLNPMRKWLVFLIFSFAVARTDAVVLEDFRPDYQLWLRLGDGFYGVEQDSWHTASGRLLETVVSFGKLRYKVPWGIRKEDRAVGVGVITILAAMVFYSFLRMNIWTFPT